MRVLLIMVSLAAGWPARAGEPLPFIDDDYPRAIAEARQRKVPVFVDTWAPWCHTCRFMRGWVFSDLALASQAKRFVWLSIDTEKEKNGPFLAKYPIDVWPTLMVIDPAQETAVLRWPGSATVPQLLKLLEDGERALRPTTNPGSGELARADRLAAQTKYKEAAAAYRTALTKVAADHRPRVVESELVSLQLAREHAACAQSAVELTPSLPRGPSFANAVAIGLGCAEALPKGESRARALARLEPLAKEAVGLPGLLADDRSGLFEELVDLRDELGDAAGKKALAATWLAFLESEAEKARDAEARAALDPHRVLAALAVGEPARALPPLQRSEHDLPNDYNAAARLAIIYSELGRYDDAIAACNRALAKVYGPRKLRVLETKASIEEKRGDRAAARRTLETAIGAASALPAEQHGPQHAARLKAALTKLGR